MSSYDLQTLLRKNGFRVTKAKEALLTLLEETGIPLSVHDIMSRWKKPPNQATVYRILTDLTAANIVRCINTIGGISLYEYTPHKPHHHHAICTDCGAVADIPICLGGHLEEKALSHVTNFTTITTHELTFYGTCIKCN
jgi:Fe2+ or Zn2+ uptake regulation protein